MIAREYGQDPRTVATWEPDWLAAALTAASAEAGASNERRRRDERARRAQRGG
jgi:hypothetical protein